MFAGIGGEILYRPFYQNFAIGDELWEVQSQDAHDGSAKGDL